MLTLITSTMTAGARQDLVVGTGGAFDIQLAVLPLPTTDHGIKAFKLLYFLSCLFGSEHSSAEMGPCQGRLCGLTVSNLIAQTNQISQEQVGYYHIRMPIKPLTINELADLSD